MDRIQKIFMEILGSLLTGRELILPALSVSDWRELYQLTQIHKLELAFYPLVCSQKGFDTFPEAEREVWRKRVRYTTIEEIRKVKRFQRIYKELSEAGLKPLIVKGTICRFLYERPYDRPSADEDLLVSKEERDRCKEVLKEQGMDMQENGEEQVIGFQDRYSQLRIELHQTLFEEKNYADVNKWFEHSFYEAVRQEVEGMLVWTMSHTLHMLYLFSHFIKHFLGIGIGIRQVCDITRFINTYGKEIEWEIIWKKLTERRWEVLCVNLIHIGILYLGLEKDCVKIPEGMLEGADSEALLADLLDAGIYGTRSSIRQHSSVATSIPYFLFPSPRRLRSRYPFIEKRPWLLPFVWIHRIVKYIREKNAPAESFLLRQQRIRILKQYGVNRPLHYIK